MCLLDVASCSASHHQSRACVADPCVMAPLLVRLKKVVALCLAVALCAVVMDVDVCCAVAGVALGAAVATYLCVVEDTCVLAPLLARLEQVAVVCLDVALRAAVPYVAESIPVATCVCVSSKYVSDAGAGLLE